MSYIPLDDQTENQIEEQITLDDDSGIVIEYQASPFREYLSKAWHFVKTKTSAVMGFVDVETYMTLSSQEQDIDELNPKESPEMSSSFASQLTFTWFSDTLKTGMRRPLYFKDLEKPPEEHDPLMVANRLESEWNKELDKTRTKLGNGDSPLDLEYDQLLAESLDENDTSVDSDLPANGPSLKWALIRTFYKEYLRAAIPRVIRILSGLMLPFMQNQIVTLIEDRYASHSPSTWKTILYGVLFTIAIFICYNTTGLAAQRYWFIVNNTGLHIKAGMTYLIYKKLLRLSAKSKQSNIAGTLSNLISTDIVRLMDVLGPAHFIWAGPFASILSFIGISLVLGPLPTLTGYSVLFVVIPLTFFVTKKLDAAREATIAQTDARVKSATEIFHAMKVVKMYALEDKMGDKAGEDRSAELRKIKLFQIWSALHSSINEMLVPLMSMASILCYVLLGNTLTAAQAFTVIGLFAEMSFPIRNIATLAGALVEAQVAIGRLTKFLLLSEKPQPPSEEGVDIGEVLIENGTFHWDPRKKDAPSLSNLNFKVNKGELVCIMGAVGSGKSSLLNAVLGELVCASGSIKAKGKVCYVPQIPFLLHSTVRENICFGMPYIEEKYQRVVQACALQPDFDMFIAGDLTQIGERGINLSGGQKARISMARAVYGDSDIILLDDPLSAVDAHVSRTLFHEGIQKLLVNKTVLLVTHQLQFVSYGHKLVVMQDGGILVAGTVQDVAAAGIDLQALLDMYHGQLRAKEAAEQEATMRTSGSDIKKSTGDIKTSSGEIRKSGDIRKSSEFVKLSQTINKSSEQLLRSSELQRSSLELPHASSSGDNSGMALIASESELDGETLSLTADDSAARRKAEQAEAAKSAVNVDQAEERGIGRMGLDTYKFYFSHLKWAWLGSVMVLILYRVCDVFVLFWIAKWSSGGKQQQSSTPKAASIYALFQDGPSAESIPAPAPIGNPVASTKTFLTVYLIGNILVAALMLAKQICVLMTAAWTGQIVYLEMFNKLLRAPMSFFDTTPKGRITARCSSDTDAMDSQIGSIFMGLCGCIIMLVTTLIMIGTSMHGWTILLSPLVIGHVALYNRFVPSYREIARLIGLAKAPLFTQIGETLDGLYTLRAFKQESTFMDRLYDNVDRHQRSLFYETVCVFWFSVRCDFLAGLSVAMVALFAIINTSVHPTIMAVALGYAIMNAAQMEELMYTISSVEAKMNCIERIQQYTQLEVERAPIIQSYRPPESWPQHGKVEFQNVSMQYRVGLPPVLNDISFTIKPSEKVGVVGRTGAGKSSLFATLLSLTPLSGGKIIIDGYDINMMGVSDLRSKLSIIPQDPTIFSGNIRTNLDPFGKHTDMEIWSVLERVHLRSAIEVMPDKLDTELSEDGSNLSLGQRQLLCVGRALLKRSKILLLDEASSSIDLETDHLLQKTLRQEFSDCTTITIAHRLATILDSDRVLVMAAGKVVEFDTPHLLLRNPNSLFYSMYQQSQASSLGHVQ